MDDLSTRINYGLADAALQPTFASRWWMQGNARIFEDDRANGTLAIGRDFGGIGFYVAHNRGHNDELHQVDQQTTAIGLRSAWKASDNTQLSGTLFAGVSDSSIDSADSVTGSGDTDGHFMGVSAKINHIRPASSDSMGSLLSAQLGITRFSYDAFSVSGLNGARFSSRDVTTGFLSTEAAFPMMVSNGMELRPFIGAHALFTDADQVTMTLPGGNTSFATDGDKTVTGLRLGTELHLSHSLAPLSLRLETQIDEEGTSSLALGALVTF